MTRQSPSFGRVDQIMVEERAATFTKRSIKTESKLQGLRLVFSMLDLTTLEGRDTPGKVMTLCHKAMHPAPERYKVGPVAAVCVYPNLVPAAKAFLRGSNVKV
ncbi:MAG: deoxyribose-phosphate aldolase, partial [Chthoniobacterales bacterium]